MTFRQGAEQGPEHDDPVILVFGDSRIDIQGRELRHNDVVVNLEPRIFDLLAFMAQHPQKALSKDELQAQVWPGLVVSDTVVSQAVMKARRAVGDSGQRQAVIATIHGYGYRFVAPVTAVGGTGDGPETDSAADTAAATSGAPGDGRPDPVVPLRPRRRGRLLLAPVLLVALLAVAWKARDRDPGADTAIIAILSSATAGDTDGPAIDGSACWPVRWPARRTAIIDDRARACSAPRALPGRRRRRGAADLNQALGSYLLRRPGPP